MFDFLSYWDRRKRSIDAALDTEIPSASERPAVLHKAIRYSVFSGGKRIRPILCLAAAEAAGGKAKDALFPALALELLHTYTLIHDDLPCMDDDDLRRGKPTCHVKFGEANALLAADALQAMAFGILAKARVPSRYPATALLTELARAAGSRGVVGGQVEDLAAAGKTLDAATIEYIHLHKTADLFRAAARMGALAANAGKRELHALTDYGVNVGLAFQITDDILDGPAMEKKRRLVKSSCLAVYGPQDARQRAEAFVRRAATSLRRLGDARTEPLRAMARFVIERVY